MIIFKTKFDQNNTSKSNKLPQSLKNLNVPQSPCISIADITIYFDMKVIIFYSEFFQNMK